MPRLFTAWLTIIPSDLDTAPDGAAYSDVTVLADEADGHLADGRLVRRSVGDPVFHAVTTQDARTGDDSMAITEAEAALRAAGWTLTGTWEAVPTGCTVTVERPDTPEQEPAVVDALTEAEALANLG